MNPQRPMAGETPVSDTATAEARQDQPEAARSALRYLRSWEALLAVILLLVIAVGAWASPFLLTPGNFSNLSVAVIEVAIMALPMALVIITGEIDLSVESVVGMSSAVLGFLYAAGVPLVVAIPTVLVIGAAAGLLNGLLVTKAGLPSLVVTLGTLALYRGVALVVLGPRAISQFPSWFTTLGFGTVPGTPIPWPLLAFAALAIAAGLLLHKTWVGREIYAIGKNARAASLSGVRVARVKTSLFVTSGIISAFAGVILTARFASARADAGENMTLTVATIVLLGGVNIFGGAGSIVGVTLAAALLAVLENVLRLVGIHADVQTTTVGVLLIASVSIPNAASRIRLMVDRLRSSRAPPGPLGEELAI